MNHLLTVPPRARALYVCAHGAGAGMRHRFLEGMAAALGERGIGVFRYEFPYMEAGGKRVDSPAVATERVREAVLEAAHVAPGLPLVAGGKSFGGRMTSEAQAKAPLPGVTGLAFLGFPLHAPGRPSQTRADHLARVEVPMLFLQGTRDEFANLDLLRPLVDGLGPRATLQLVEGGDHSFAVRARRPPDVHAELAGALAQWLGSAAEL